MGMCPGLWGHWGLFRNGLAKEDLLWQAQLFFFQIVINASRQCMNRVRATDGFAVVCESVDMQFVRLPDPVFYLGEICWYNTPGK